MGIYSSKHSNEHAKLVDVEGKQVEDIGEKLEVCVMLFDKLYNYAPVVKLPEEIELE